MVLSAIFGIIKPFLVMGLVFVVSIVIYLYLNQNKMIYVPEVEGMCTNEIKHNSVPGTRSPEEVGIPFKEVRIKTRDNLTLYGWFMYKEKKERYSNSFPTFVYFHENAGNIGFRLPFSEFLHKTLNANILVVGYRGYGYSEGSPNEQGIMLDAEAIIDYVFNKKNTDISDYIDTDNVYIFGRSLGGAVAIYAIDKLKPKIKGLILENTFSSMGDLVDKLFPFLKRIKHFLLANKWPSRDRIHSVKCPVLFFCSQMDELVPYSHMEELYKLATGARFKQKYTIDRGTHNESWQKCKQEYLNELQMFMERCEDIDVGNKEDEHYGASINDLGEESQLIDKKTE